MYGRCSYLLKDDCIEFKNKKGEVVLKEIGHSLTEKEIYKYFVDSEADAKVKQTANGEISYMEGFKKEVSGKAYTGS